MRYLELVGSQLDLARMARQPLFYNMFYADLEQQFPVLPSSVIEKYDLNLSTYKLVSLHWNVPTHPLREM